MTLYVMCGLSRAGKTTFAKDLAAMTGAELVCLDDEMRHHPGRSFFEADDVAYGKVKRLLSDGKDTIYDSMSLCRGERELILRNCRVDGCRTICVFIDTPEETIRERGGVIPYSALKPPKPEEDFDEIWTIRRRFNGNSNT